MVVYLSVLHQLGACGIVAANLNTYYHSLLTSQSLVVECLCRLDLECCIVQHMATEMAITLRNITVFPVVEQDDCPWHRGKLTLSQFHSYSLLLPICGILSL